MSYWKHTQFEFYTNKEIQDFQKQDFQHAKQPKYGKCKNLPDKTRPDKTTFILFMYLSQSTFAQK